MKTISRLICSLFCVFLCAAPLPAFAQFELAESVEQLAQEMDITPEQRSEIAEIVAAKRSQVDAIRHDPAISAQEKMSMIKEIRFAGREEILATLTDRQRAFVRQKLTLVQRESRTLLADIDLDAKQVQTLRSILEDAYDERQIILEAAGGDRRAARSELMEHRNRVLVEVRSVLSSEQRSLIEAAKSRLTAIFR